MIHRFSFVRISVLAYSCNAFIPSPSYLSPHTIPRNTVSSKPSFDRFHRSPRFSSSLRRSLLSEDDLARPPDKRVIKAVEDIGGNDILASGKHTSLHSWYYYLGITNNRCYSFWKCMIDVASKAGVSLNEASQALSSLAALSQASISVSSSGDLLYTFPSQLQSSLASNSLRYKVTKTWDTQVWPKLFWVRLLILMICSFDSIFPTQFTLLFAAGDSCWIWAISVCKYRSYIQYPNFH